MNKGRLIGIDHGNARIGLAVCDASWIVAKELCVIKRKSKEEDFARIAHIVQEQQAVGLIIGLPYNETDNPDQYSQADTVKLWAERLLGVVDLPYLFWDERFSSADAQQLAKSMKRKPTQPIDDLAARLILQNYLDAVKDNIAEPLNLNRGES